ncbi:EamA family transporter [Mycolicibacterium sp. 018/SC-01/001]|uniref:EamA family transporter n=1 Tax=Mycolicibacterium sp. 018/SC-01/001 TaxID=2592069 RepID=UPI00117D3B60|nr:EamA family transporter [Mycolicibacterium sp. 018/SC-01/001]TRW80969.1 EamA family transporter [Mycolicibacterium sp. 018/SC-01/001]
MSISRAAPSVALILGSCVSLQLGAVLAIPLLASLGAGLTTSARLLLAAVLLMALHRPRVRRWGRERWRHVLLFGVAMAGMNGFFYASIARIPLGIAVTIEFAGPLLLAAVLSRRPRDLACVGAAAASIAVLGLADSGAASDLDPAGVMYALVAAAFWAFYIKAGARMSAAAPGNGSLAVGMLVSGMLVAPFGIGAIDRFTADPHTLVALVGVAVLSSVLPYSLEFAAMGRVSPHVFGVLLCLEPIVAGIAGWLLLHQTLPGSHIVAMAVVVAAALIVTSGPASSDCKPDRQSTPPVESPRASVAQ